MSNSKKIHRSVLFFALLLISLFSEAQNGLEVEVRHQMKEYTPGQRYTLILNLTNRSNITKQISSELRLPSTWGLITPDNKVELARNESKLVILSFYIPTQEKSGNHDASIIFRDAKNDATIAIEEVSFTLTSYHNIAVSRLFAPDYVQAGEEIEALFEIRNKGNTSEKLSLYSRNQIAGSMEHILSPDSAIQIKVTQKSDAKNFFIQNISLNLEVKNEGEDVRKKAFSTTKVFPTKILQKDAYMRYPIETSLYNNSYINGDRSFSSKYFEIKGSGHVDFEKEHYLNFVVRAPNQGKQARFGVNDQYSFIYRNKENTTILFGDHTFNLNRLGFSGRYGFGLRVNQTINKWNVGAFYTKPRLFTISKEPIIGAKASYSPNSTLTVGLSISRSKELAQYYNHPTVKQNGTAGHISVFEADYKDARTQIHAEVASSVSNQLMDYASDINISHHIGKLSYRGNSTMAGKNFFGTLSNSLRYSNSLNYTLQKWNLGIGQSYSRIHERVDTTLYGVRPYFENYYASIGRKIGKHHFINVRLNKRHREDQSVYKIFNYKENGIDYRYKFSKDKIALNYTGQIANTQNLFTENRDSRRTYGHFLNVNYKVSNQFSVRANINYTKTNRYSADNTVNDYLLSGGGFNYSVHRDLRFSASYNSGFSPEDNYLKRDFVNASIMVRPHKKHQFEGRMNYYLNPNSLSNNKELFAFIKYTFSFGAPIKKILQQGGVKGRISSSDASINLKGTHFIASGNSVRTDTKGGFELNNLTIGTNYIILDESSLPENTIVAAQMPLAVEILEDQKIDIEIPVVKAANLKGLITLAGAQKNLRGYLKMQNDDFTYYAESNEKGEFQFDKIVPGEYKLTLMRLVNEIDLERNNTSIMVNTDEIKEKVQLNLKEKERKVQFKNKNFKLKG